ncbi:DUF934 domain-containing protein [Granulosicoccus antarcticus]|uniref:DUF934 domain-containing protein n=1 Tax=Granulosicoccus antarcticus IMCC3135 TaxID=1192854 RepID=A0A2Z2NQX0_9GAMM|nr:DUF934 domain-containing protein [Granulosicoccus antarcticus]ASJ72391.1 hypothetical protein IMCC3135_11505 [Granulosicoccus antarcticus IMCC3135]
MPLLRNGQLVSKNPWVRLEDDADYPLQSTDASAAQAPVLASLTRFLALQAVGSHTVSGVYLAPEDDVQLLAGHLHRIQLIVIDFPKFTDGRGYSQARMLRDHFHFSGELRASGDIRPDQLLFMARAGIDAFEFTEAPDELLVKQILSRFRVNYQPSYALPVAG